MSQVFKPSSNTYAKLSIFGALFAVVGSLFALTSFNRSDYMTQAHVARQQPVPFSHKHHVGSWDWIVVIAMRRSKRRRTQTFPDRDVHELPLANLVGLTDPGARSREVT